MLMFWYKVFWPAVASVVFVSEVIEINTKARTPGASYSFIIIKDLNGLSQWRGEGLSGFNPCGRQDAAGEEIASEKIMDDFREWEMTFTTPLAFDCLTQFYREDRLTSFLMKYGISHRWQGQGLWALFHLRPF